jgi:O-antigen ligase
MTAAGPAAGSTALHPVVRGALYLFVFSIPFELPERPIPIEIPTLTGFVLLFSTLIHPSACFRRVPAAGLCFLVYLWAFLLAAFVNRVEHGPEVRRLFIAMVQLVLLLWVVHNALAHEHVFRGVLVALVIACVVRAGIQVAGIATAEHEQYTGGARVTALGQNANLSALILAGGLAALVGGHLSGVRFPWPRVVTWPLAGLIGLAIIQSGSRGGLLSGAVGLAVLGVHSRTLLLRLRNAALAAAAVGLLGWGAFSSQLMRTRLEQAAAEGHLAGRERIYPAALALFRERPLFGWGPIENQYEISRRLRERERPRRDAHNLTLELLTATGVVGAIPFLAGVALCVRGAWRARRGPLELVPLAMLTAVLTGTASGTWIAAKIVWLVLVLALAAGAHWAMPLPNAVRGAR